MVEMAGSIIEDRERKMMKKTRHSSDYGILFSFCLLSFDKTNHYIAKRKSERKKESVEMKEMTKDNAN